MAGCPRKAPAVIPAPKPEPVVPPSPAKTIAQQLNDAFVSVFERVAPAVVIIDVTKKPTGEGENSDYFPDFFLPARAGRQYDPGLLRGQAQTSPKRGLGLCHSVQRLHPDEQPRRGGSGEDQRAGSRTGRAFPAKTGRNR